MPTLDWMGKDKVINYHQKVPYRVLENIPEKGVLDSNGSDCGNMIIHGDNLEALKALLPEYENRIDCIYIDPPYNTGNEKWIYNDNVNDPRIKKWIGEVVGPEGEDFCRHDKWLCMMYPRLQLLRKLLTPTGIIFISIDDNELANLKYMCDEIFSSSNLISCCTRIAKRTSNKGNFFKPTKDYLLVYAKNVSNINWKFGIKKEIKLSEYKYEDHFGRYKKNGASLYQPSLDSRPNQRYYIECPDGSFIIPPGNVFPEEVFDGAKVAPVSNEDKCWRWSQETYLNNKDKLIFTKASSTCPLLDSNKNPSKWNIYDKVYLHNKENETLLPDDVITEYVNSQGTKELNKLGINFAFSKPVGLIEYLLSLSKISKDAIILDSFAGSGTTAQAILEANKRDGGTRKFILIELGDYADAITAERVRRVINGYGKGKNVVAGIDTGFSYYELGTTLFLTDGTLNPKADRKSLYQYIWYSETKSMYIDHTSESPYLLGQKDGTVYYFLYEPDSQTTLSKKALSSLPLRGDTTVIYADRCSLSKETLQALNIVFKQIPRKIARV